MSFSKRATLRPTCAAYSFSLSVCRASWFAHNLSWISQNFPCLCAASAGRAAFLAIAMADGSELRRIAPARQRNRRQAEPEDADPRNVTHKKSFLLPPSHGHLALTRGLGNGSL